jgi:phospholipid-binding lipoprotein MlaA
VVPNPNVLKMLPHIQNFKIKFLSVAVLTIALGACATKPPASDPAAMAAFAESNDQLEPFNRAMFGVDQALDTVLIRPVAWTYREFVPDPARRGVTNFLRNLRSPITLANSLLQGNVKLAGQTVGRFIVNSTFGILGFADIAADMGTPYQYEDFGQTLATWGVGDGSYLYLPVFGPMSVRDGFGMAVDHYAFDPVTWYNYGDNPRWVEWAYFGALLIDVKAGTMSATDELKASSIDYYASLRSAYRQNRAKEIRNGAPAPMPFITNGEDDPFAEAPAKK